MEEPKPAEPAAPVAAPAVPETPAPAAAGKPGVMDVVAPPPGEKTDEKLVQEAEMPADNQSAATTPQPKAPKSPNVGLAITATVIIVLGLAALATYAYLKSR